MIRRQCRRGATVGADKGYDTHHSVGGCRKAGVALHVAAKRTIYGLPRYCKTILRMFRTSPAATIYPAYCAARRLRP